MFRQNNNRSTVSLDPWMGLDQMGPGMGIVQKNNNRSTVSLDPWMGLDQMGPGMGIVQNPEGTIYCLPKTDRPQNKITAEGTFTEISSDAENILTKSYYGMPGWAILLGIVFILKGR